MNAETTMDSINGDEVLSPDQRMLKYGETLKILMRASSEESEIKTIFTQQFVGDHHRHPSLIVAHKNIDRYNQHKPAPPIAGIIGQAHTIFKAGATKLPKLDIQTLEPPTQRLVQEFKDVLTEYQKLVADTREENFPPDYQRVKKSDSDKISDKATQIVDALNASELVTSSTIPVIVTSDQGIAEHIRVENKKELGSFLFALPHVSQNLMNLNRVPIEFQKFLNKITYVAQNIVVKEVDKLYSSDALKAHTAATFESTNEQLHTLFWDNKRALQLAVLVSSTERERYISVLDEMAIPHHLERLENTLEATVILESIAHYHDSKLLDQLVRRFSEHIEDNAPPADLLAKTQAALTEITGRNDRGIEKLKLLNDYIAEKLAVAPDTPQETRRTISIQK